LDPNDQYSWAWGINHYEQITGYIANSQTNYAFAITIPFMRRSGEPLITNGVRPGLRILFGEQVAVVVQFTPAPSPVVTQKFVNPRVFVG
jgi:hypothetical protein